MKQFTGACGKWRKGGGVERGITVSVALIQILTSDYSSEDPLSLL